jgi:hypothetical protein
MLPFEPGTTRFTQSSLNADFEDISCERNQLGVRAMGFLDEMYDRFGEKKVIYISFGTEHWFVDSNSSHPLHEPTECLF